MKKRMNELSEGELEARLKVNEYRLHEEIIDQPELYYHAAREAAIVAGELAIIEDEMKELKAKLYSQIRSEMEEKGEHVTEGILNNAITTHPRVVKKRKARREATYEVARLEALKSAYYQRSFTLRDLASIKVREMDANNAVKGPGATEDYSIHRTKEVAKQLRQGYEMPSKRSDRKKGR